MRSKESKNPYRKRHSEVVRCAVPHPFFERENDRQIHRDHLKERKMDEKRGEI